MSRKGFWWTHWRTGAKTCYSLGSGIYTCEPQGIIMVFDFTQWASDWNSVLVSPTLSDRTTGHSLEIGGRDRRPAQSDEPRDEVTPGYGIGFLTKLDRPTEVPSGRSANWIPSPTIRIRGHDVSFRVTIEPRRIPPGTSLGRAYAPERGLVTVVDTAEFGLIRGYAGNRP